MAVNENRNKRFMSKAPKLKRIKVAKKDEVRGFYKILTSDFRIHCLPDNEYILQETVLKLLKKEKINLMK